MSDAKPPSFRNPDLTDDDAYNAMTQACNEMVVTALAQRRLLLALGFTTAHRMCRELDRVAQQWTDNLLSVRDSHLGAI